MRFLVSIPFKRESISKVIEKQKALDIIFEFQFPSNGKAYPKLATVWEEYQACM